MAGPPVMVLPINTKRETGRTAQLGNISAAKAVSEIIRTTLGPRSMLKMLLDPMGGIVITNDGNCILREVDVSHPAAKSMIELSRAQDEEVGDGTTSVIILAGEMLAAAEPLLLQHLHPTQIVRGYAHALQVALETCTAVSKVVDLKDRAALKELVEAAVGTKFSHRWGDILVGMAIDAVTKVVCDVDGRTEVDVKRYVRVEKVPGGELDQCRVLDGVMFNKDVTHARMRRRIESPRILLLDCPLEYKKGESATNVEVTQEDDWNTLLRMEEEYVENICAQIVAFKPDIVITEKGVSDLAQHYFMKANITCFRRLRKSDNNRVARAVGATIVSRPDEIQESDIGTGCGLFEVRKIGDEYFAFLEQCKDPKACTVLLRGGSKDVLNEVERNLQDAMQVVRNVVFEPRLLPGGGATEMAVAAALTRAAEAADGAQRWPVAAVAGAFEAIPRTLAQNCGASVVRTLTQLRAKHAAPAAAAEGGGAGAAAAAAHTGVTWGINGVTGELADMDTLGVWEPYSVKVQTYKTAIEAACMILRIDDIVSGVKTKR
ncbi:T-complex protein 1 gamma subunit [Tribonema minus]|uniref:T-complex protein 1 subunit gamma n=1 Tax=Tribonema minus TaxID=303371 RepID=A0A836CR16_9STRA|nr:T-complex protein 1 gamma subunit [Tribonema minus]